MVTIVPPCKHYPMVVATTRYHLPDNSQNSNLLHVQQWQNESIS